MKRLNSLVLVAAFAAFNATAVFAHDDGPPIVHGSVKVTVYDGVTDDLLSAGLNQAGLVSAVAPGFADPLNPTPAELRRRAIYNNYRGIVDPVPAGGMGLLWGPGSPGAPTFAPPVVPGLIPGVEYKAYLRTPGRQGHVNNIPAAVQIPRHFNPDKPCIVAAPPSGSRSLYGGIAIAEWALFKGCAVALPGKGTDTGFHLLGAAAAAYAVDDIDGVAGSAEALGDDAQFALKDSRRLDEYVAASPYRIATKHAHSQLNPEGLWGRFTLDGIEFAFWALNDHFDTHGKRRFDKKNTLVIAAGASNGAGMALRALEDDERGLIDALVVTEPNIGPQDGRFVIRFGADAPFDPAGRTIYDSITLMSVFAPCAALSPTLAGTPFFGLPPLGGAGPNAPQNRCAALKDKGLVSGATLAEQADSALAVIRAHGYAAPQDWGIASHEWLSLWRALQVTYANAYGRFAVEDNLCGMSFAATDATLRPAPIAEAVAKRLFADSSGVPPTGGVNLIADWSQGGPILENFAVSRSSGLADLNLESALCFRSLQTGEGLASGQDWANFARVRLGTREIQTTGRLHGKPAIVIHGRRDALVFPNLQSRAYFGLNQQREGNKSRLSYIEVTTGQHFDTFISSLFVGPGGAQFAPLHYYLVKAMDSMYAHLTSGAALPPSQVVRPTPRGAAPYTSANVPALLPLPSLTPAAGDRIIFANGVLSIPE
ncbi:MAG TPA: 3-hydroxybutyrate oligomer hydrolase family protein [Burkholderiales bacterium]|nr:3-hydroxybutyrate oligomer hydrolase family protein [Burkholderiales bacterium]